MIVKYKVSDFAKDLNLSAKKVLDELARSEEHTSELQSLFTISYAVSLIGRAHV